MAKRWVVVFRLTPRGGTRSYVVEATDEDDAVAKATSKLAAGLPYGIGWDLVGARQEDLR